MSRKEREQAVIAAARAFVKSDQEADEYTIKTEVTQEVAYDANVESAIMRERDRAIDALKEAVEALGEKEGLR
jgi:hypothetical protein